MEKTLTFENYVSIKNLLTKIKGQLKNFDESKEEIHKTVVEINKFLNDKK